MDAGSDALHDSQARSHFHSKFSHCNPPIQPVLTTSKSECPPPISLLRNRQLDTLALRQRDPRLLTTDDEDVRLTGRELVVDGVLDVHDVEASVVALAMSDDAYTAHVAATRRHGDHTSVEADEVGDLACEVSVGACAEETSSRWLTGGEIDLDGIIDLDRRVWKANSTSQHSAKYFLPKLGPTSDRRSAGGK